MLKTAQEIARTAFTLWAKTGKASGLLYSLIDKHGSYFDTKLYKRNLFNKIRMACNLRDHIQQQIYFFGAYEPIELSLLLSLISPGAIIVDAGANIGFYTLMMAKKTGPRGQIHAFEPIPENFSRLSQHVDLNPEMKNISLNPLALWNKEEQLHFKLSSAHQFNCGGFSASNSNGNISCKAISLDQYCQNKNLERIDIIKMDIEGAELYALEGALNILEKFTPIICLEICRSTCEAFGYSPNQLWDILKPLGYSIYEVGSTFRSSGWRSDFSHIIQRNVLLLPEQKRELIPKIWDDKTIRKQFLSYS